MSDSKPPIPQAYRRPLPTSLLQALYQPEASTSTSAPLSNTAASFGAGWEGSVLATWAAKPEDTYSAGAGSERMIKAESLHPPGFDCGRQLAALQSKLDRQLGPEYLQSRPGPGGSKLTYIEGWKVINIANEVFGFNGWSHSVVSLKVEYLDQDSNGKISAGATCIVRVTLRDGTYHEDAGWGSTQSQPSKGDALEKANKEAVTDALKRALRSFGNLTGNCLYDKEYLSKVKSVKAKPARFDEKALYRRPDLDEHNSRSNIITDPINPPQRVHPALTPTEKAQYQQQYDNSKHQQQPQPPAPLPQGAGISNLARSAMANSRANEQKPQASKAHRKPNSPTAPVTPMSNPGTDQMPEPMLPSSQGDSEFDDCDLSGVDLDVNSYSGGQMAPTNSGLGSKVLLPSNRPPPTAQALPKPPPPATHAKWTPGPSTSVSSNGHTPSPSLKAPVGTNGVITPATTSKVGSFSYPNGHNAAGPATAPSPSIHPRTTSNNPGAWKRAQSIAHYKPDEQTSNKQTSGRRSFSDLESMGGTEASKKPKIEYHAQGK